MDREHDEKKDVPAEVGDTEQQKLRYSCPQLTVYGRVEELTRAVGSSTKDGINGSAAL